jgi:DNA adenine methylase
MTIERDFYCDVRDSYNKNDDRYSDGIKGWVGFMGSFNGRYFDGGYSGHNVIGTNGKSRDYISENINNTLRQVPKLKGVEWQSGNYWEMEIPENSLIYCDIPYNSTNCGKYNGFNHQRFYEWADKQENIFISEYSMPADFVPIAKKEKVVLSSADGNGLKAEEYIFTNKRTYDKLDDEIKWRINCNLSEQMTFF